MVFKKKMLSILFMNGLAEFPIQLQIRDCVWPKRGRDVFSWSATCLPGGSKATHNPEMDIGTKAH